jgi:hypothetical protein
VQRGVGQAAIAIAGEQVGAILEYRLMDAPRASLRDSVSPPAVEMTTAWMRSPIETSMSPSASLSSSTSIVASPLPPTSTKATSGPIATIVPSIVCPCSMRFAWSDASNIAAKSSVSLMSCSVAKS